jgi:hypothetical protein
LTNKILQVLIINNFPKILKRAFKAKFILILHQTSTEFSDVMQEENERKIKAFCCHNQTTVIETGKRIDGWRFHSLSSPNLDFFSSLDSPDHDAVQVPGRVHANLSRHGRILPSPRILCQVTFLPATSLFTQRPPQKNPIFNEVFLLEYIQSFNLGSPTGRTCEKGDSIFRKM